MLDKVYSDLITLSATAMRLAVSASNQGGRCMNRTIVLGGIFAFLTCANSILLYSAEPAATSINSTAPRGNVISLFDGKTLDGWIQEPAAPTTLSGSDITDYAALAKKLQDTSNPLSVMLMLRLDDSGRSSLAQLDSTDAATLKMAKSALVKSLNKIVSGPAIFDAAAFKPVQLRGETEKLHQKDPQGKNLVRLNRMLLEDAYPAELSKSPSSSWIVKDGAMAIYRRRPWCDLYQRRLHEVPFDVHHAARLRPARSSTVLFDFLRASCRR